MKASKKGFSNGVCEVNGGHPRKYERIKSLLFLLVCTGLFYYCDSPKTAPPNVIVIMTDDQGWGDLSYHGNRDLQTPHIDAIARSGAVFENFYVSPVCSPTRAEFLTGRYHFRSGVYSTSAGGERLNLGETTIAEVFKSAGYNTALYGKWHSGMQYPYHPNARGFDDFYGFCSGHWGHYFDPLLEHNGELVRGEGYITDDLANHATAFIDQNKNQPFFIYLALNTPHSPMQVPEAYWERFENKTLTSNHNVAKPLHTRAALAMCENSDYNVGKVIQALRENGLEENTIIVFLSDNGPNGRRWNAGMKGTKGTTDEGGTRSPLFIQWKNTIPHQTIRQLTGAVDLLPTLTALAGIDSKTNNPLDGMNFKSRILKMEVEEPTPRTLFHYWRGVTSVRNQNFRLDKDDQLFHIAEDRNQTREVSSEFSSVLKALKRQKDSLIAYQTFPSKATDLRPHPVGHPDAVWTQLPARDAQLLGDVKRSNRYPNASYITNWQALEDTVFWNVDVQETGTFEVILYITATDENIGNRFKLGNQASFLEVTLTESHDPPLIGAEQDRFPRIESYVKDFKPLLVGELKFQKGKTKLEISPLSISGGQLMELRMVMLKRKS